MFNLYMSNMDFLKIVGRRLLSFLFLSRIIFIRMEIVISTDEDT